MRNRTIGGITVGAIGLGGMPMSIEGRPDEARSIRTIHAALDAGVTLIDTADAYHMLAGETGHNERLIARALVSYPGDTTGVLVATKGGHVRPGDGSWLVDGSPAHLRQAVALDRNAGENWFCTLARFWSPRTLRAMSICSMVALEIPARRILPWSSSSLSVPTDSA
jgi:hypothetical protein